MLCKNKNNNYHKDLSLFLLIASFIRTVGLIYLIQLLDHSSSVTRNRIYVSGEGCFCLWLLYREEIEKGVNYAEILILKLQDSLAETFCSGAWQSARAD